MKKYIIKEIVHHISTGHTETYYWGITTMVWEYPSYASGWTRKYFAEKAIEKQVNSNLNTFQKLGSHSIIENNQFIHIYSVIETEEE